MLCKLGKPARNKISARGSQRLRVECYGHGSGVRSNALRAVRAHDRPRRGARVDKESEEREERARVRHCVKRAPSQSGLTGRDVTHPLPGGEGGGAGQQARLIKLGTRIGV